MRKLYKYKIKCNYNLEEYPYIQFFECLWDDDFYNLSSSIFEYCYKNFLGTGFHVQLVEKIFMKEVDDEFLLNLKTAQVSNGFNIDKLLLFGKVEDNW